jgi:hypothetical protein
MYRGVPAKLLLVCVATRWTRHASDTCHAQAKSDCSVPLTGMCMRAHISRGNGAQTDTGDNGKETQTGRERGGRGA